MDVDTSSRIVTVVEKIKYKNTSSLDLNELYINVYANAFSSDCTYAPFLPEFENDVYIHGKDYSTVKINTININNHEIPYSLNDTVLKLNLMETLKINEEIEITLQFDSYVPKIAHRLGGDDDSMWFGNFIPSMAVLDSNGWNTNKYYPVGDPFYSDIANYDVTITTPKNYTTVSSGVGKTSEQGDKNITTISARLIRDFAFSISKAYKKDSITTKDGIEINFYNTETRQKDIDRLLLDAKKSIEYYVNNIGSYPYPDLDIAECDLYYEGSMEYPMFIMVDKNFFDTKGKNGEYPYNFGLQWFNCIIGIDQSKEGWLNYGITAFVQSRINYGDKKINDIMTEEYKMLEDALATDDLTKLTNSLEDYTTWNSYNNVELHRSKLMIYSLYRKIGANRFDELLKTYYSTYSFKTVKANDFFNLAEKIYGGSLNDWVESWVNGEDLPEI